MKTNFLEKKKSEGATLKYRSTKNPHFQFNLTYKFKQNKYQWRIVFWDPKRQEFTLENPPLTFQPMCDPLNSLSAFH